MLSGPLISSRIYAALSSGINIYPVRTRLLFARESSELKGVVIYQLGEGVTVTAKADTLAALEAAPLYKSLA